MTAARLVFSTAPDSATAHRMVRQLVEEQLVACGNILPGVTSIYSWHGTIEEASEVLIIFKTTDAAWPRLQRRLIELHPYDVPELIAADIIDGHGPYLEWVEASIGGQDG